MKKIAALALSLSLLFSTSSCIASPNTPLSQSESMTEQGTEWQESNPNDSSQPNGEVIESHRYYKIEKLELSTVRYTIYNERGTAVFSETTDQPLSISMLGKYVVHIAIGMGTGTSTHRYYLVYDSFSNSKEYSQVIASTSEYVAYLDGTLDDRKVVVKGIYNNFCYCEYTLDFEETPMPVISASISRSILYLEYYDVSQRSARVALPIGGHPNVFDDYNSLVALMPEICTAVLCYGGYTDCSRMFGITNDQEAEWFNALFGSLLDFAYGYEKQEFTEAIGYALKDLNGDGIEELILLREDYEVIAIFTTVNEKVYLLDNYWNRKKCFIDQDGTIFVSGSGGADTHSYEKFKISDDGRSLELMFKYGLDGHEWVGDVAVQKYYKTVNGKRISITEAEFDILCEEAPFLGKSGTAERSGLTFVSAIGYLREAANQAYLDVLENKMKIQDMSYVRSYYLMECKDPYSRISLYNCTNLAYALVDLDGDTVNELVIECPGGPLLLRYYEWYCGGTVFVYDFTFRNMYNLCTDGSFSWNHNGSNIEYGEKQLYFVGTDLMTESLWHIVNDGEPDAEYYIGDRQVTEAELTEYINSLTQTKVAFSPLQLSLTHTVTAEQALEIACKFWNIYEGDDCHALGTIYVYHPMILTEPSASHPYYHIGIMVDVYSAETNYQSFSTRLDWRQVTVNAVTGECTWFDPNAKGDDVPQIGK